MSLSTAVLLDKISSISSEEDFSNLALEIFHFQYENVQVYQDYCRILGKTNPKFIHEIPCIPISLFKSHQIFMQASNAEALFKSSGTSSTERSQHFVHDLKIYETLSQRAFENFFGPLHDLVIFALLPNYLEQGNSSLVYMVKHFINLTQNTASGFYLDQVQLLVENLQKAKSAGKKTVLFGVSYALIDLAEKGVDLRDVMIIETGGMKGRRKEMPKEALHEFLKAGLNVDAIYSEYGMTELLSQAYCKNTEPFVPPLWMRVMLREANDPFTFIPKNSNKSGGISIIDLANLYSCSFIHTDDLGKYSGTGFLLLGRFDHSDIRGCNQLVSGL